jgi:hypothetical protein
MTDHVNFPMWILIEHDSCDDTQRILCHWHTEPNAKTIQDVINIRDELGCEYCFYYIATVGV